MGKAIYFFPQEQTFFSVSLEIKKYYLVFVIGISHTHIQNSHNHR